MQVETDRDFIKNLKLGASVCVDGVCLTVTKLEGTCLSFDIIAETLNKTSLASIKEGSLLNLERSLTFGSEIGGHLLTGHVSTVARISQIREWQDNRAVELQVPIEWAKYLVEKTHIAIDGISLTIVKVFEKEACDDWVFLKLILIPETLERSTFGTKEGSYVNLEFNHMTKTIVETTIKYLQSSQGRNAGIPTQSSQGATTYL